MNNNFFKATIIVLALINTKAFANDADRTFYWSNARGLVKAENCKFEASSKPSLGVVYNSEVSYVTLEKNEGLSNLDIKNMSLVKNLDTELTADKLKVEVVAINSSAGVYKPLLKRLFSKGSVRPQASRGDQGLVDSSNLLNIEKYYIKMNNNNYASDVGGVFWSAYYDDKYVKLNCPEFVDTNNYTIFNIHNEENGKVVSRVGVSSTETELFKDVLIYTNHKIGKYHPDDEISFLPKKVETVTVSSSPTTTTTTVTYINPPENNFPKIVTPTEYEKVSIYDHSFEGEEEEDDYEISTQTGMNSIICTPLEYINVRNESLDQILFTAKANERIKIFQGWGSNYVQGYVDGKSYTYVKVEFLDKEDTVEKIGYVVASNVSAESNCNQRNLYNDIILTPEDTSFTGLDDKDCCIFPTMKKVTTGFTAGQTRFGASRDKGARSHAAVDLYRYINEPIVSVAPGVVIMDLYFFYQGTYALEVVHSGGFLVRYGELTGARADNVSYGKQVGKADRVGYIGKVNSGCCEPMLHFELYSGKLKGPLTQPGVKVNNVLYNRRRDLLNPTRHLLEWQNAKF